MAGPDLNELHPAVRESVEREINTRAEKAAEEKLRAKYATEWSWLTKEEREAFVKDRGSFASLKEKAARAERAEAELNQLRSDRNSRREEEPVRRQEPAPKPQAEEVDLADLERGYELNDDDRKFYRGIVSKAEERGFKKSVAHFEEKFAQLDQRIDARLGLNEEIKAVRSDPRWSDPEIGDALQFATQGIMALAEKQGRPMSWIQAKEMASGMKAFQPKAAPAAPAPARPAVPAPVPPPAAIPRLGDAGSATRESGGPGIDVFDDNQLMALFKQDPQVRSAFARGTLAVE